MRRCPVTDRGRAIGETLTASFNELLDAVEAADRVDPPSLGRDREFLEFGGAEYGRRHQRAAHLLDGAGIDALVLAEPSSVRYFTGLRSWFTTLPPVLPIVAVVAPELDRCTLIDTTTERGSVERATWIEAPELYGANDDPMETVAEAVRRRGLSRGRLGFELGAGRLPHLSPADQDRLRSRLPEAAIVDASQLLHAIRAIKTEAELALIRRAAHLITVAFAAVCAALRPGMTELEMTRIASRAILDEGGDPDLNANVLIFMAGANRYAMPLLPATGRPLREGELISLDGGCSVQGYHSDFARAAVIGELDADARAQLDAVHEALTNAVAAIRPGRPLGEAWVAAQSVLDDRGLAASAVNPVSIGHSIGLDHWERPTVAAPDTEMGRVTARPGMVLCVEPQIAGAHGDEAWARGLFLLEDQVVVTSDGVENLTASMPAGLHVVPA